MAEMCKRLVLAAILVVAAGGLVQAGQKPPSLVGLARAMAAEQHCNVLIATEKLELERTTQSRRQTETAKSSAIAKQMFDEGIATGAKARCDELTTRAIKSVLRATRASPPVAVTTKPVAVAAVQPDGKPETKPVIKPNRAMTPTILKKPVKPGATKQAGNLAGYGSKVEAYYRELRCPTMSNAEVNAFYRDVMRAHHKAVQEFGMGPAATAVKRAEARANAGSC
jgi:hypothetical protein